MHDTWPLLRDSDFPPIKRGNVTTLQLNLGYRCNLSCIHCHVNAGPGAPSGWTKTPCASPWRWRKGCRRPPWT